MSVMSDPGHVHDQYATEGKLGTRRAAWQEPPDGRGPAAIAAEAIRAEQPRRVLEVGCGTGEFAERVAGENPDAELVAIDQSPRLVELTIRRGVTARQADAAALPLEAGSFDVVAALWMLYHVPNLDQALAEIRRVLRPGGLFVAVTNGDEHLADLLAEAGGSKILTTFSIENAEESLRRHFQKVSVEPVATRAVFPNHAAAAAYLASFDPVLADRLPAFAGPRTYAGSTAVILSS